MTVCEFAKKYSLSVLCLPEPTREIKGAYAGDLLSWVMGRAKADDAWITIMSNRNVAAVASLADTACVVFAEGVKPDAEIISAAEEKGINLFSDSRSTFELCAVLADELL